MTLDFPSVRAILIDLDGVLYRGRTPLPHAVDFIKWLRERQVAFRLVTNNATLTPAAYVDKLARIGIPVQPEEVFTSALATGMYLRENGYQNCRALVIGEEGLCRAVEEAGLLLTDNEPQVVVVGLDRHVTYDKLAIATLALNEGAAFIASNADTSFPTERGLLPGAGALTAALVAPTGRSPIIIGKPEPLLLQLAREALGTTSEVTVMLGDRLDTDIAAARADGTPSILVLTGVSSRDDLSTSNVQPDLVVADLGELMREWHEGAP